MPENRDGDVFDLDATRRDKVRKTHAENAAVFGDTEFSVPPEGLKISIPEILAYAREILSSTPEGDPEEYAPSTTNNAIEQSTPDTLRMMLETHKRSGGTHYPAGTARKVAKTLLARFPNTESTATS
ncbi:hypothetical protein K2P56_00945 [Patescibacteria group bacterium]|nr:hypothetical protein [Patescibacteria group bacterium]